MTKQFCKITLSGRCAKTKNESENTTNCTYNSITQRCKKVSKKKETTKPVQKKTEKKQTTKPVQKKTEKKETTKPAQKKGHQKQSQQGLDNGIPLHLQNDLKTIEFAEIPQTFSLTATANSNNDLDAILDYFKIPNIKSKTEKIAKIKECISKTLQKAMIKKIHYDTVEVNFTSKMKVRFQFNQCESISLYDITVFLLYFNIYERVSKNNKIMLCEKIEKALAFDEAQIAKRTIQTHSMTKNCSSFTTTKIDSILYSMNIERSKAEKKVKCAIIENIKNYRLLDPYVIVDDNHILFNTKPKRILYSISQNLLTNVENFKILTLLAKDGLLSAFIKSDSKFSKGITKTLSRFDLPPTSDIHGIINFVVVNKKNFPNHSFLQQFDDIPESLSIPVSTPHQFYLSNQGLNKLSNKMNKTVSCKTIGSNWSGKYKLIDLVPKQNIMKNGKDIRMYHGTKVLHWKNIKSHGIKAIGGGALGQGFYFTPSVPVGIHYCFREKPEQSQDLKPVLAEVIIKDADKLTVGEYWKDLNQYPIVTTISSYDNQGFWQFVVRSENIIKKHFRIDRVFKLNV